MPGPCTFVHCVTAAFFIGSVSGGDFHHFRGFPSRRASASRLPNAGTSLATLLSFANGVVTRRRVQVYTLPLSAPGSLSAPWPPTFLRQAPITAEDSRFFVRRLTELPRDLFNLGPAAISSVAFASASLRRRASVSRLPGLRYGPFHSPYAAVTRRCTQVWHDL